ncbi:MAG: Si-specific NAD(P)(+) transhydrogenase [Candidatus Sumerlaeia bacterium]|nr:Si-specific NAD(P)(+) transhydrogenase [Candidatus Sumerlaeia bacterium]
MTVKINKEYDYDLLVIGSGPAGQKGAIAAADEGARVAIVEKNPLTGGVCLNTGTIPSKSLREAVLFLSGYRQRGYYGDNFRLKERVKTGDLVSRTNHVIQLEREVIDSQLSHHGVKTINGTATVVGPHHVKVELADGGTQRLTASSILIAVGTKPRRPVDVPFDSMNILDSDGLFHNGTDVVPLPDSIAVLGSGVIGIEYASMFGALDIPVVLVDPRENPISFVDGEISRILFDRLSSLGMELVFGDDYSAISIIGQRDNPDARVRLQLNSGREYTSDSLLFALGREPLTRRLGLERVGVEMDRRGYITVDESYRSTVPSIFAAGDVIGFPSLASTSADQGRIAALNAIGGTLRWVARSLPFAIYTIPEISMIGSTEEELIADKVDYVKGTALWRHTARGKIIGDLSGAIKLLFTREDRRLVGVHIIGDGAAELLHIGQAVMDMEGPGLDYFLRTVFNYPTLGETYKMAAFNAARKLEGRVEEDKPLCEQVLHGELHENFIRLSGEVRLPGDINIT